MSTDLIRRAREQEAAATPGPWREDWHETSRDAAFIATARNLWPLMLDVVEAAHRCAALMDEHWAIFSDERGFESGNLRAAIDALYARMREEYGGE